MELIIKQDDILKSKEITNSFDKAKTYNKFGCSNNYIGALGELLFNSFLTKEGIIHNYNELNVDRWGSPPFTVNGNTITIKTTRSGNLWLQKPKFDFTIYAKIGKKEDSIELKGFVRKDNVRKMIADSSAIKVQRDNRSDYVVNEKHMEDMSDLMYYLRNNTWPKKDKQSTLLNQS